MQPPVVQFAFGRYKDLGKGVQVDRIGLEKPVFQESVIRNDDILRVAEGANVTAAFGNLVPVGMGHKKAWLELLRRVQINPHRMGEVETGHNKTDLLKTHVPPRAQAMRNML